MKYIYRKEEKLMKIFLSLLMILVVLAMTIAIRYLHEEEDVALVAGLCLLGVMCLTIGRMAWKSRKVNN